MIYTTDKLSHGMYIVLFYLFITMSFFADTPFCTCASATALTHLVSLRARGDNGKHPRSAQRTVGSGTIKTWAQELDEKYCKTNHAAGNFKLHQGNIHQSLQL